MSKRPKKELASPYDLNALALERIKPGRPLRAGEDSPYTLYAAKRLTRPKPRPGYGGQR